MRTLDETVKPFGFVDARDFNHLVSIADLSTMEKRVAFNNWYSNDGTKAGLLKLPQMPHYRLELPGGSHELWAQDDAQAVKKARLYLWDNDIPETGLKLFRFPKDYASRGGELIEVPFDTMKSKTCDDCGNYIKDNLSQIRSSCRVGAAPDYARRIGFCAKYAAVPDERCGSNEADLVSPGDR